MPESDEDTWAWRTIGPRGPASNSQPACLCLVRTAVSFGSRGAGRRRGEPRVGVPTSRIRTKHSAPNMRCTRLARRIGHALTGERRRWADEGHSHSYRKGNSDSRGTAWYLR